MDETRVSRYKEYRASFIKEGAIPLETPEVENEVDINSTTSTLPIDEVINAVQTEKAINTKQRDEKRAKMIKIIIEISIALVVIAGLVVLGYFAWR